MATTKKKEEAVEIVVPAINMQTAVIHLVGDTPLIMHKWTKKAKQEILDKHMKKAKTKDKDPKDPVRDFIESMNWLDGEPEDKTEAGFVEAIQNGARFGFPAVAFKAAAVNAGYRAGITKNTTVSKGAFRIDADFIEIKSDVPVMREDMVRVQMTVDIRYRGEFRNWSADIPISYNASVMSLEQIVNLFNLGGFACGVGEWRMEKGGVYGSFHVG